mmetsp:Transcript_38238/g.75280  ORF Transcript_38238/g.75280 Transcript_38238/m.75280 type:complete len:548 (-) Transcript_38238:85-1728(-)
MASYLITVHAATDLAAVDKGGTSDPYVILTLGSNKKVQTKVIKKCLNPQWEESFVFSTWGEKDVLHFHVRDWDRIGRGKFLGEIHLRKPEFSDGSKITVTQNVQPRIKLDPLSPKATDPGSKKDGHVKGSLTFTIVKTEAGSSASLFDVSDCKSNSHFVFELISCVNVPKEGLGESDPYFKCYLSETDHADRKKRTPKHGKKHRSLTFLDTRDPVYRTYFNLGPVSSSDFLVLELWDYDVGSADDFYGQVVVPVSKVTSTPVNFDVSKCKNCSVQVRRVKAQARRTRDVFFIRHGESTWNQGQRDKQMGKMLNFDHPLNKVGVQQAVDFNTAWKKRREEGDLTQSEQLFFEANAAFSSPLTRAAMTALLTLQDHKVAQEGLTLLRTCREIKNQAGFDTVGKVKGVKIIQRSLKKISKLLGEQAAKACTVPVDPYDAISEWWTRSKEKDDKKYMDKRYHDFFKTLRYCGHDTIVVVGHSLFIREMCRRMINGKSRCAQTKLAEQLKEFKLDNAACLRTVVEFPDPDTDEGCFISEVEMMFGSKVSDHK